MKEDLKEYVKELSKSVVIKFMQYAEIMFPGERLNYKHIKMLVLAISPDPITTYNRQGLCVQNSKLKSLVRVLCKAVDNSIVASETNKYGQIDKKIYKGCAKLMESPKCSTTAVIAVATIVSELCGILLQSLMNTMSDMKTLSLDFLKYQGICHTSNHVVYQYSSMIRFIYMIEQHTPLLPPSPREKKSEKKKGKHALCTDRSKVSFECDRPSTPENCFWEE